jgi:alpha-1,2-mannosyltransferase
MSRLRILREPGVQRAAILMAVAVTAAFRLVQLAILSAQPKWGLDLSAYWLAGRNLLTGAPIYSVEQLSGPYIPEGHFEFLYPPPFAALFAILAAPFGDGYRPLSWIWLAIGAVLCAASVAAVARVEHVDRRFALLGSAAIPFLVALALVLPPVIGELDIGNVHLELLALFSLAWLGIRRGDARGDRVAGVAIGIASLIKVFPLVVLMWLVATRRVRSAMWAIGAIVGTAIALLPFTGLQAWLDYPSVLLNMGAIRSTYDSVAPTVWLAPVVGFGLSRVLVVLGCLAILAWSAAALDTRRSFAVAVTVSVLIAPAVFHHYLSILVLPLLLALADGIPLAMAGLIYLLLWGGQQPALGSFAWVLSRVPQTLAWGLLLVTLARSRAGRVVRASRPPSPNAPCLRRRAGGMLAGWSGAVRMTRTK